MQGGERRERKKQEVYNETEPDTVYQGSVVTDSVLSKCHGGNFVSCTAGR